MRRRLEFEVRGTPAPQGDHSGFLVLGGTVRIVAKNKKTLNPWRDLISGVAQDVMGSTEPFSGPIAMVLEFRPKARPASHFLPANSRRPVRVQRLDAPIWNTGKPDSDKLGRAAMDALSTIAYGDDKQVVDLRATKRWPDDGEHVGVTVRIVTLEETR